VQAANGSLGATEQGYLDVEHGKLATALGTVVDQAKFNDKDLVGDTNATPITIQSGADAGDTTALSFAALTESILEVDKDTIDMTGATKAVFEVTGVDGSNEADGRYSVTINGITYQSTGDTQRASAGALITEFNEDDFLSTDGNNTKLKDVYAIAAGATSDDIKFTALAAGDHGTSVVIAVTQGSTGTFTAGNSSVTKAGGTGISVIDAALATVAEERAKLGATQAQLESTVRNLANVAENTSAAAGRIMDTDYAAETANLTKAQILQQAATSILAQANAQPQSVLALLR
jgi:flagellin